MLRPYIISAVFIAAWVACGRLFQLGAVSYSLIGMPFVAAFQLVICRRPIYQLWVRDAENFGLDKFGFIFAIALIAVNACSFWPVLLPWHLWGAFFLLLLILGSTGVAYAFRQQRADKFNQAFPSMVVALLIGGLLVMTLRHPLPLHPSLPLVLLKNFIRLLPATFICDEVVFRGLLDSYVAASSQNRYQAWISAIFVSALWAFWHTWHSWVALDFVLTLAVGIPLSFCWRRSGTLLLPGTAHAIIDTFRDTILYSH